MFYFYNRFAKIEKLVEPVEAGFKANLKSTGKNKFALEEEKDEDKVNFRDQVQLKSAKEREEVVEE
jgi:hypothetical protein